MAKLKATETESENNTNALLSTYLWINRQQVRTLPKVHLVATQAHMGLDILQTKKY